MGLKIKEVVDRKEKERERLEAATEELRPKGLSTAWRAAPVLAQLADAATTEAVRRKHPERFREANPLLRGLVQKPLLNAAVKAAAGAGMSYVADKVQKKNKKGGKLIAGLAAATGAIPAANNAVNLTRKKKGK